MNDIMICNIMETPDFPYSVAIMYPREIHNEKILQDNLKIVTVSLKLYIKESEMLDRNKQVLKHLKFESQQEKQKAFLADGEKILNKLLDEMNKDIKPYHWTVHKNVDSFVHESNIRIKADYVFALE